MPDFLIERVMPGVSGLSASDLRQTSQLSFAKMQEEFPTLRWLQSYATDETLYCVYRAPDEVTIREYAKGSPLPVHKISEIRVTLDPATLDDS
ncbi:MAG TPA: DUF4242 domain-containing protein [Sphingomicrobium sp.]